MKKVFLTLMFIISVTSSFAASEKCEKAIDKATEASMLSGEANIKQRNAILNFKGSSEEFEPIRIVLERKSNAAFEESMNKYTEALNVCN